MNKMNVLSLFDGLAGARIALDRLNIPCNYYSSEIDKYVIKIAMKNYPTITQLGDITKIKYLNGTLLDAFGAYQVPQIDLLIGGSPCQDLSISKKNRQGLQGERSGLFFEYVRLLKEIKPKYFLLENVNSMSKVNKQIITDILKIEPIMINSALLTAQNRKRLYWFGKIVNNKYEKVEVKQPKDKGILLKDILEKEVEDIFYLKNSVKVLETDFSRKTERDKVITLNPRKQNSTQTYSPEGKAPVLSRGLSDIKILPAMSYKTVRIGKIGKGGQGDRVYSIEGKSVSLSANGGGRGAKTGLYCVAQRGRYNKDGSTSQKLEPRYDGKTNTLTSVQKDNQILKIDEIKPYIRKLTPLECERLQSIPDHYSEGVSNSQRYKMIGNGFTCDVIKYLLSYMDLK